MYKEIPKSDIIIRPLRVYKEWSLDENDIQPIFGENVTDSLFDADTAEKSGGFYKRLVYDSTKAQFYYNPATSSIITEVGLRKSYASTDERILEDEIVVFPIPQAYYGEGIKIGSVTLLDDDTGRTYTDDKHSNLIDSGSNIKGNIFYDLGLVVVTKDITSGSNYNTFRLNFRSTKTIYENEIFISVLENEYNFSQNPSAYYEDGAKTTYVSLTNPYDITGATTINKIIYSPGIKYVKNKYIANDGSSSLDFRIPSSINPTIKAGFADYDEMASTDLTGSYLAPYITTIGLYDEDLDMVAVAKLPQPIKSLPDYPVNFIIRFDT
jgi:hypothetical protein